SNDPSMTLPLFSCWILSPLPSRPCTTSRPLDSFNSFPIAIAVNVVSQPGLIVSEGIVLNGASLVTSELTVRPPSPLAWAHREGSLCLPPLRRGGWGLPSGCSFAPEDPPCFPHPRACHS